MRKIFKALTILSAVLACATSVASAATTRTVNPHLISARAGWVGQVDATTLAYGARIAGSGIEVLADGTGTPRAVAAPDGCSGAAAGSGHLLFACERGYSPASDARRAVVTAVDGSVQASLDYSLQNAPADSNPPGVASAIGSQWIHHTADCLYCDSWSVDLNWHTGEIRQPDLRALTSYEDLDAPDLLTPLCAPLKQNATPVGDDDRGSYPSQVLGVQVSGRWVLQGVRVIGPDGNPTLGWQLRHCDTTKVYKTPAGTSPVALAGGFVVLVRSADGAVELLRLRDRRVFRLVGVKQARDDDPQVAATAHRLLIRGSAQAPTSLWSVMLPQK